MAINSFFLDKNEYHRPVIRQEESDLAITIFNLQNEPFFKRQDKFQLFGQVNGAFLAFQCALVDYPFETEVISAALTWYAELINQPAMDLSSKDPRVLN